MRICLSILLILSVQLVTAQTKAVDSPSYNQSSIIPPINILQIDSTILTKKGLNHQATLIMFFSPDCDHCKQQWKDMEKRMKELKKYQIIMVTYQPFEEMVEFYKTHKIADYPNIKMGRDIKFILPPFYHMQGLPFQALYDKYGNLLATFDGNVAIDKILSAFKGS